MSCACLFWGHCVWVWSGRKCNRQNRNDGIFLNFWPLTCKTQTQADLRSPRVKTLFRNFLQLFSGFSYLSLILEIPPSMGVLWPYLIDHQNPAFLKDCWIHRLARWVWVSGEVGHKRRSWCEQQCQEWGGLTIKMGKRQTGVAYGAFSLLHQCLWTSPQAIEMCFRRGRKSRQPSACQNTILCGKVRK